MFTICSQRRPARPKKLNLLGARAPTPVSQRGSRSVRYTSTVFAGHFSERLAQVGLDWELVSAVAESHKRAAEGLTVDRPANLDEATGSEVFG
jgi:hypothetical protein